MDGDEQAVRTAIHVHAGHGTTTLFPTTTTGSPAQINGMLDSCEAVQAVWQAADGARIAGVHFYGPYFAEDKVGAHPQAGRRDPDPVEYSEVFDRGIVQIATCAAELPGAVAFYREAHGRSYLVTCGHSNAGWREMQAAFTAGVRHVDHFWCAMSSIESLLERFDTPMQGSMEHFVLMHEPMSTEVIADGEHLAPELLEFAFRMKGPDRLCLVTDASGAVDMPAGEYMIGPRGAGEPFWSDTKRGLTVVGRKLASSVTGMDHMVRHMAANTTATLPEVVQMASLTPARRAGVADSVGSLEVGKRADVVVFGPELDVKRVFLAAVEYVPNDPPSVA